MTDRNLSFHSNLLSRLIAFFGTPKLAVILTALVFVSLSGCKPVSNSQAQRGPFGLGMSNLFGGNSNQYAQNNNRRSSALSPNNNQGGFGNGFSGNNIFGLAGNQQNQNGVRYPNQNSTAFGSGVNGQSGVAQGQSQVASQFNNLNQRLTAYDTDNQLLNTELAGTKQKLELANQYSQTLKQQLADTSARAQQSDLGRQEALRQLAATQGQVEQLNQAVASAGANRGVGQQVGFGNGRVPAQLPGATLYANNSLARRIGDIQIPGGQARMDGDVIRIEFPTDKLFVPGQYQIQPAQLPLLQNIVGTIRQNFPKQIIGIEAHWDNTPLNPVNMSHHQLTVTQALAVFDRLTTMGIPKNQMFILGMGSNRPRHAQQFANGISPNRRVELVIYPETYDGSN